MKPVCTDGYLRCFSPQLQFDMDKEIFPMVVQAVVDEGEGALMCFVTLVMSYEYA